MQFNICKPVSLLIPHSQVIPHNIIIFCRAKSFFRLAVVHGHHQGFPQPIAQGFRFRRRPVAAHIVQVKDAVLRKAPFLATAASCSFKDDHCSQWFFWWSLWFQKFRLQLKSMIDYDNVFEQDLQGWAWWAVGELFLEIGVDTCLCLKILDRLVDAFLNNLIVVFFGEWFKASNVLDSSPLCLFGLRFDWFRPSWAWSNWQRAAATERTRKYKGRPWWLSLPREMAKP